MTELMVMTNAVAKSGLMWLPGWIPTESNRRTKVAVAALDEIVMRIVNERRASGEDRGDLLSMLLLSEDEDGNRMTDQQVRDEAVTLFLAGYETTANALTYVWILLAEHPEVVAKLHEELERVLGGRPATAEDLRQLTYTQMIVKETLRLYPTAPTIARQNIDTLTLGGYTVPKDTVILIPIHAIQRDARWFDQPDAFIPERFAEGTSRLHRYAYFPFGGGPRVCLGNMFAEMEIMLVLATMAQHIDLRLEPNQSTEPVYLLALRPKGAVKMKTQTLEMAVVAVE
jgi:cytochrome P450